MFKRLIKKLMSENGQSVMELAITLPILIVVLGGIVDFGWLFTNQNIIDHCAREGARYAIVHSTGTGAITTIKNYTRALAPTNISSSLVINVIFTTPTNPRSGDVQVTVSRDVTVLTPIIGVFLEGQQISLDASCTMKVE